MNLVSFYGSKLACRKGWEKDTSEKTKELLVRVMMVEAYYKQCGYGERPKCEYLEL